ncbi:MFS transporter [Pseudonocardia parietis]|uniref:Sugar phosphate permease n=1 Tax=Pseudonocardia parietis TaxID=570936 RepID=A0ABS4W3E7_9PSEU|nr:MFS transporter [Pseudonocardia parietis]MBP2370675.1 sugar phosphate permease [Pseudonocardia parietis]
MSTVPAGPAGAATLSSYRWVVLFACWLSFTLTSIDRSTWGPASVFVGEDLAVPFASLGVFATAYYIGYVISNALGGIGTDRLGGRWMLSISLFGAGAFMTLFGSTTSATVGIAVQAMVGLFAGADYSAGIRLVASWFPSTQLGLPMGIFVTATSLGTAIANSVVPAMIAWHGWDTSYHFFGVISMVLAVLLFFVLRPGPMLDSEAEASPSATAPVDSERSPSSWTAMLANRNLVLTAIAGFGGFWGLYGFITWANALMIKGHGITPATAGAVVAIFAITAVVVKPIVGFVSDRFFGGARRMPAVLILALFVVTLLVFGNLSSATAFLWLAPLLGAAAYGWTTLLVALVPRLVPSAVTGTASGFANAFWQLGSVIVPLAVGGAYAATGSFMVAFLTLAAGPALGALVMLAVREQRPERADATLATRQ